MLVGVTIVGSGAVLFRVMGRLVQIARVQQRSY